MIEDVKHEETAEFWRAMHAEEKRKKQSVSAKLSLAVRENGRLRDENQDLRARLFDAERLAHTNCRTCWDETYLGVGKPCPDCNDEEAGGRRAMKTAITVEAVKSAWTLDEEDFLVEDEAECAACGERFEPDQQALEVYDPLYDAKPYRAIVPIHLPCYQGEELH